MCQSKRQMWSHCDKRRSHTLDHLMVNMRTMVNATIPLSRKQCASLRFDHQSAIDVVIPWVNMTEGGFFDDWHPYFWKSAQSMQRYPYRDVGKKREPFSEIIYTIRSILGPNGPPVRRVLILYDDQMHGPPSFLKPSHSVVMAVPSSLLAIGTGLVNVRRRLQTSLAMLHRLPGLSEHFLFLPDDCVLLGQRLHGSWSAMLHPDGRLLSFTNGIAQPRKTKTSSLLYAVFDRMLPKDVVEVLQSQRSSDDDSIFQNDIHGPFMMKRCFVQELHDILGCEMGLLECNAVLGPRVCDLEGYHFQLMTQNYARLREVFSLTRENVSKEQLIKRVSLMESERPSINIGEMHVTNCLPKKYEEDLKLKSRLSTWLNLQGDGISDEYSRCDEMRIVIDNWYETTFPQKGQWEK